MITLIPRTLTLRETLKYRPLPSNCECYNSCLDDADRQAKATKGINESNCSFVCVNCGIFKDYRKIKKR